MGRAQQSVRQQVHRRRLREGDVHRRLTRRTLPGLWVSHAPFHDVLSDWPCCFGNGSLLTAVCLFVSHDLCFSSQSGVVNIYSQEACLNSTNPKPLKAVMNLLTSATSLAFNPSSEILAIASRVEDEAARLVSC